MISTRRATRGCVPDYPNGTVLERDEIAVDGRSVVFWRGGEGDPLLLLHGGLGGAEMHWSPVWEALAREFRVIAPEFPGLAYESSYVPRNLEESAQWAQSVLDATNTPAAWIAGISPGAAVASRVASRSPERCLGLILVNGGPPPKPPAPVAFLSRRWPMRQAMVSMLRRIAYSPSTLHKAFADPRRAPDELRELVTQRRPRQLYIASEIMLARDRPVDLPPVRTLLIWGAEDRLAGTTAKMRQWLERSLTDAQSVVILNAGHLPQIEQPERFVRAVVDFARAAQ